MKKTYSLVLGWWAAKWLCHIWVLKYIEEKDISISEVCWTSMGAMISAAVALGKTSKEIEDFVKSINFLKLIDLGSKKWIVAWDKVMKKMEEFLWDSSFENTAIPLKIIATDLINSKTKVFSTWKILPAIRASISLPSIFTPQEIDWIKYVDWWLRQNLPLLEATNNNIIAVSAISETPAPLNETRDIKWFILKRTFFWINYQILKKTIATIMKTNEELCQKIATIEWKNVVLLTPDISQFEYYDFHKVDQISKKGYEEATKKLS